MNVEKTPNGAGQPASILIVDDTSANLQVLSGMLKERGYRVRPVPSGKLALQAARRDPPDLILLDINMPEMDGYEVCGHLKTDNLLKDIPVIFISALTEQLDKVKAFAMGGVDYLTKPFQMEELHARVDTHLNLRRLQTELEKFKDYNLFMLDTAGKISSWNPGAEKNEGYKAEEIIGQPFCCLHTVEDVAAGKPLLGLQIALKEGLFEEEGMRLRKGGSPFWARVTITRMQDSLGRHLGFAVVTRDVTQRKHTEAMLQLRDRAIESLVQGLCITDPMRPDNPIIYVNDSFMRMTGYAREEVMGRNYRFLQGPGTSLETVGQIHTACQSGKPCLVELLNYQRDGTPFWNGVSISPIRDAANRVTHFVWVLTDISPLKLVEQQLQQAQKMEVIGQLAGGVAHDFNNLLTVITGYSDLVLQVLPEHDPVRDAVNQIREAGERAAGLTRQLLFFSSRAVLAPKVLDLNVVVQETERLLRRTIGEDIVLTTNLDPNIARVKVDPSQMGQILMNLAINARDALPRGGQFIIETSDAQRDQTNHTEHSNGHSARHVLLVVSDNGCGMTPEVRARIFEPFFTTKGPGKGTGLGLATVYGIVKQSGGTIKVTSAPGQGTTFKIYLPAVGEQPAPSADDLLAARAKGGVETILLVEDDDAVRAIAVLALRTQGYTVLPAANARKTLRAIEGHRGRIDLLVTDVVMPGMNGPGLAEAVRLQYPCLKVLYQSGYTDDTVLRNGIERADVAFLQKPYTPRSLARKVREVLDQAPDSPEPPSRLLALSEQ
jgi:two-component system, cell cycle sensor histidine kinase and response regulator CckA